MTAPSSTLQTLPVEVLLDHVLPTLPTQGLLNLSSTSRQFADLGDDDTLWKRKLLEEFNFSGEGTARTSGWKFIYRGLSRPQTYVWGDTTNGRLGLASLPDLQGRESLGIPFPVQVRIPGRRIVSLIPGGWSFHALDSTGAVYVWGTLDATMSTLHSDGFAEPAKMAETPHRLVFPSSLNGSSNSSQGQGIGAIRSISCGRAHTLMLSSSGDILTFQSWGRPYTLASPLLKDHSDHEKGIKQIEAGWGFCAVLTHAGDIYLWWPGSDPLQAAYDTAVEPFEERIRQGETGLKIQADKSDSEKDGIPTIPCMPFELDVEPSHLAEIPIDLPELPQPPKDDVYGESVNLDMERTKIVKLAGGDNFLIALTNRGHVLKYDNLTNQAEYTRGRWEYLPNFSEVATVREHGAFQKEEGSEDYVKPPEALYITHISAHFNSFVAYSTGTTSESLVLMGNADTSSSTFSNIIPALQHRGVISVVLGDYHYGALTATGELLTWGEYSHGALGLGDPLQLPVGVPGGYAEARMRDAAREGRRRREPESVKVPTEVKFGRKGKFVIQAAAAGWHMGALVIDVDPDASDADDADEHVAMPGSYEPTYTSRPPPSRPDRLPDHTPGGPSTYESPPFNPHPSGNQGPPGQRAGHSGHFGQLNHQNQNQNQEGGNRLQQLMPQWQQEEQQAGSSNDQGHEQEQPHEEHTEQRPFPDRAPGANPNLPMLRGRVPGGPGAPFRVGLAGARGRPGRGGIGGGWGMAIPPPESGENDQAQDGGAGATGGNAGGGGGLPTA